MKKMEELKSTQKLSKLSTLLKYSSSLFLHKYTDGETKSKKGEEEEDKDSFEMIKISKTFGNWRDFENRAYREPSISVNR